MMKILNPFCLCDKNSLFLRENIMIIVTTKYIGDQQEQEKETCFPFIDHYDQNNKPNHPINPSHHPHHHQYYFRAVYFPLISVLIQKVKS